MKDTICNYGYCINKNDSDIDLITIKRDLNMIVDTKYSKKSFKVFSESTKWLVVPIYYYLNSDRKYTISFNETQNISIKSNIILRESQKECYKVCCEEINKPFGGGIIHASLGLGKTIISLKLIEFFSIKTLIVVNKVELLEQWKREINKHFPLAKVGIIQGTVFDIIDKDIVIGTVQTISIKDNLRVKDFTWVGLCIIDEVHNIGSEIFSKVFTKIRSKYMFGLTATLERKDGMEKVIKWFLGEVIYSDVKIFSSKKQETSVRIYRYFGDSSKEIRNYRKDLNVPKMLTKISEDPERNKIIIKILKDLLSENKNNKILVISDRVNQLKILHKILGECLSGLYIGSCSKEERKIVRETKRILLGTYQIVMEGFNLPELNCLLFATPRSNVTQAVGRIYRKIHNNQPIIVDIFDTFSLFQYQYKKRMKIYIEIISKINLRYLDAALHDSEYSESELSDDLLQ
ncbi:MAG TPA: DEAD/DEAH box helicase family protein [Allocoleopsis sp.]